MKNPRAGLIRDAVLAFLFFVLSTWLTWLFIEEGKHSIYYADRGLMYFSCAIAGAKWGAQIAAALCWLARSTAFLYIRRLSLVCLIGSLLLIPYFFLPVRITLGHQGFYQLLLLSVAVMIPLYYRAVKKTGLDKKWFWGWMACLAVAVTLQIVLVFN